MPMTINEVILPAVITVGVMIATKFAEGFFTRWQSNRQQRLDRQKEESKQRREDRLRSERERDEWREKYFQEKEDHLETLANCQDYEKRLTEALRLLDRRKHTPAVDHLVDLERKRKSDQ